MSSAPDDVNDDYQRSNWRVADSYLRSVFQTADGSNLDTSFSSLLETNIILTKGLIVHHLLRCQTLKQDAFTYGVLAAKLNLLWPDIGALLVKEGTALFIDAYNRQDRKAAAALLSLLSNLFNYEVVHEIVILQLMHLLLENLDDFSINLVVSLLADSGKHLMEVSNTAHNMIYEKLRELLQSGSLARQTARSVGSLFDLRQMNYKDSQNKALIVGLEGDTHTHTFIIDSDNIRPSKSLATFKYEPDFMETEKLFQAIKQRFREESDNGSDSQVNVHSAKDMTGSNDIEFKKQLYLILKSSLSGDEAAHKILKLRIPDQEKYRAVDVIIKSSIQESTYSKFYGLLSEKLCSTHKSWKPAFQRIFKESYIHSEDYEPFQLRTIGKFWGHLMASDYIGLEEFECINMGAEETTAAGRIFLKFVMQELVADLGIEQLKKRFADDYVQPYLRNMFPLDEAEKTRYSINYFTAIGLGTLTENMREHLPITSEPEENVANRNIPNRGGTSAGRANLKSVKDDRSRGRSKTPPRRQRRGSLTPPRRRKRSRSPVTRHGR